MAQNVTPPSLRKPCATTQKLCTSRPSAVQNDPLANLTSRGEIPIVAALAYVPPERVAGVVGAGARKPAHHRKSWPLRGAGRMSALAGARNGFALFKGV
jgi:hypothetical protein